MIKTGSVVLNTTTGQSFTVVKGGTRSIKVWNSLGQGLTLSGEDLKDLTVHASHSAASAAFKK